MIDFKNVLIFTTIFYNVIVLIVGIQEYKNYKNQMSKLSITDRIVENYSRAAGLDHSIKFLPTTKAFLLIYWGCLIFTLMILSP